MIAVTLISIFILPSKTQVNSIAHQISLAAGLGLIIYAALANADIWKEFYQYFRESRFVSVSTTDIYYTYCNVIDLYSALETSSYSITGHCNFYEPV